MYVIQNTETGRYVTPSGSAASYTSKLQCARTFATKEQADRERCPGNETVLPLEQAVNHPGR
jgi:hypothetical protein